MAFDRGEDIDGFEAEVSADDALLTTTGTFRPDSPANADDAVADFVDDENGDNFDAAVAVSGNLDDENGDNADDVVAVGPAFGDENDDNADDAVAVVPSLGDENGDNFGEEVMAQANLGEDLADGSGPLWGDEDLADRGAVTQPLAPLAERIEVYTWGDDDVIAEDFEDTGPWSPDELATYVWGGEERVFDSEESIALDGPDPDYVDDFASGQTENWSFDQQVDYGPAADSLALYYGL